MGVRRISSGVTWESIVAYSRAVRVGPHVHVSGTTATDEQGRPTGEGDAYAQARQCLANIAQALERSGASMADVVRTRIYVTDIDRWPEIARAHHERFAGHPPATSMVEVRRLIAPWMLVEIEADAWVDETR
jgi:enamine deaminase RidA (YjgF/YER057c/UK114 family)